MKQKSIKNSLDQKSKLLTQLKAIQHKITEFDKSQADKIARMAKRYQLINLSGDILEIEFQMIQQKYTQTSKSNQVHQNDIKKN